MKSLEGLAAFIKAQKRGFWVQLVVFVTAGVLLGYYLEERPQTAALRYPVYRLLGKVAPHKPRPRYTAVVGITDDEYWKDPLLAGRVPINRKYLAKLLYSIDKADPAVIALDFDLSSPFPEAKQPDDPKYDAETKDLADAIRAVSKHRPVVLGASIGTIADGEYALEPNIYDRFNAQNSLCFQNRPCTGYIALPFDPARLPPDLEIAGGGKIMPFSAVSALAFDNDFEPEGEYAGFMDEDSFTRVRFTAGELMQKPESYWGRLHSRIVLVGGMWHTHAYNRGTTVDLHVTPLGSMPGVLLHANYIESMLDNRTEKGLQTWLRLFIEWAVTFVVALGLQLPAVQRWGAGFAGVGILFLAVAYLLFGVFGIFFEFVIPSLAVAGHFVFDKVMHWREQAKKYEAALAKAARGTR